jgi:hypothetical protein
MMLLLFSLLAAAQPAPRPAPVTARTFVEAIQPRLPERFSPEVSLVSVAAEGDLLVLTVEATPARLAALTPAGVERAVAAAFCAPANARAIMAGPLSLRVDARAPGGQTLTGAVLDTCPLAPPPAG